MKTLLKITALITVAAASLFVSSCDHPTSASPAAVAPTDVKKPRITINNNSDRDIVVGVEGPEKRYINVPARSSREVSLKSGDYKYAAAAKKTRTISGYKTFNVNKSYSWDFGVN